MNLKKLNHHSSPSFHHFKVIRIVDKVKIENCLFKSKYTNKTLPSVFTNWFTFSSMSHNYRTSLAYKGNYQISSAQTTSYKNMAIKT